MQFLQSIASLSLLLGNVALVAGYPSGGGIKDVNAAGKEDVSGLHLVKINEDGSMVDVTFPEGVVQKRTDMSAYLWVSNCDRNREFTWSNVGNGCYAFADGNGNMRDMYSIHTSDTKFWMGFTDNFSCDGFDQGQSFAPGCKAGPRASSGNKAIKSFWVY